VRGREGKKGGGEEVVGNQPAVKKIVEERRFQRGKGGEETEVARCQHPSRVGRGRKKGRSRGRARFEMKDKGACKKRRRGGGKNQRPAACRFQKGGKGKKKGRERRERLSIITAEGGKKEQT